MLSGEVCNRIGQESAWMAFKKSAVRSRLSTPEKFWFATPSCGGGNLLTLFCDALPERNRQCRKAFWVHETQNTDTNAAGVYMPGNEPRCRQIDTKKALQRNGFLIQNQRRHMDAPPLPKTAFNLSTQRETGMKKAGSQEQCCHRETASRPSGLLLHCRQTPAPPHRQKCTGWERGRNSRRRGSW